MVAWSAGLIAGGEGLAGGWVCREVTVECRDLRLGIHLWVELDDRDGVRGIGGHAGAVDVGDDLVREVSFVQPAGECEAAALRAAHLHDLGEDDGAGGGIL